MFKASRHFFYIWSYLFFFFFFFRRVNTIAKIDCGKCFQKKKDRKRGKKVQSFITRVSVIHLNMHMTIKYTAQDITHGVRLIFHGTAVTQCLHIHSDNCTGGITGLLKCTSLQCHFSSRLQSQCTGSGSFPSTRLQLQYVESDLWPHANTDIVNMFEVRETRL